MRTEEQKNKSPKAKVGGKLHSVTLALVEDHVVQDA